MDNATRDQIIRDECDRLADEDRTRRQLREHRALAQRSPEQLRQAALGTRGPKARGWRVLS
jgi:hypothetical protein